MEKLQGNDAETGNGLSNEDELVFDILALLRRVNLGQRDSILATVAAFVQSEQEAREEELKRKLIGKLTRMGCRVESNSI